MAKIPISRSEFEKGWTRARAAYANGQAVKSNSHRLLLFYAVENGLKAYIMKNERLRDGAEGFDLEVHDVNRLLARAKAGSKLLLSTNIAIKANSASGARNCSTGQINQMWRYGCVAEEPTDQALEEQLNNVAKWIEENM